MDTSQNAHDVVAPRCVGCDEPISMNRRECRCTRALAHFPPGTPIRIRLADTPTHRATPRYRYGRVGQASAIFKAGPCVDIEWEGDVYEPGGGFYELGFIERVEVRR